MNLGSIHIIVYFHIYERPKLFYMNFQHFFLLSLSLTHLNLFRMFVPSLYLPPPPLPPLMYCC